MKRTTDTTMVCVMGALFFVLSSVVGWAQQDKAVKCGRLVVWGGKVIDGGIMLISQGRVTKIGSDVEIPGGYRVIDRSGHTVVPGMIDVYAVAGAPNDLRETAAAVDPGARARDSLDSRHRDFDLLLHAGVTTAVILPAHGNVVGGMGCVVKTGGKGARIVDAATPLKFSLSSDAVQRERFPTSFMAARALLKDTLREAEGRGDSPLNRFVEGKTAGVCWAETERDLGAVLELRRELKLDRLGIIGATGIRKVLDLVKGTDLRVALSALGLQETRQRLTLPKALQDAGVDVAFYNETPRGNPDRLRISVAMAIMNGLSPAAAFDAVTRVPAEMAGVDQRVGSLSVGRDADFVVLDGGEFDAHARVREVWILGNRVHRAHKTARGGTP